MTITLNGDERALPDGATVFDLVEEVYGVKRGIAVAIAGEVVPRSTWDQRPLASGDRVEILTAVQGG
ncbi:MAG: thiamine biosynthesis protein ThiS [Pseudonocardiales bacterium]|nr:thiamine biosynthesis protein ThiS [Pseudonocardiales bacterium]